MRYVLQFVVPALIVAVVVYLVARRRRKASSAGASGNSSASAIASALNQQVRTSEAPTPVALKAQVIVNTLAMNLDKVKLAAAALKALKK